MAVFVVCLSVFVFVCLLMCVCGLFAVYCMMLAELCLRGLLFVLVLYVLCLCVFVCVCVFVVLNMSARFVCALLCVVVSFVCCVCVLCVCDCVWF